MFLVSIFGLFAISLLLIFLAYKRERVVYFLGFLVSIIGINVHIGVTFYLSRIVIIFYLISSLLREIIINIRSKWVWFPLIILFIKLISVILSDRIEAGLRIMFIYLSLLVIFWIIINVAKTSEIVKKGLKFYIYAGLVQGLYGIYQVIGGFKQWPTYQTLLEGIPMANDRTQDGYFYSQTFRAIGFFSNDVSHFAGYMAGILLLMICYIIVKKSYFKYFTFIICFIALMLSLSRSGIIAFFVFGLPSLFLLLKYIGEFPKIKFSFIFKIVFFISISTIIVSSSGVFENITNPFPILFDRFLNLTGSNSNYYSGSMSDHLLTRRLALEAFITNPLFGVGLGVNADPWISTISNVGWAGSHSYHLDILGQTGIIGSIVEWLFMLVVCNYMWIGIKIKSSSREDRIFLAGLLSVYITIILGNFLYYYYLNDFVWFIMGSGIALSSSIISKSKITI